MTAPSNYFYDGQARKYISQFMRMISDFYVAFGADRNGNITYQRVPVMYGDPSRQAATILRNNSENTINAVPAMSVYVSNITYEQQRMLDPSFTQTMQIRQKQFDPVTGTYGSTEGQGYSVERRMPVPYKLTLKLDIWTSNAEQKFQIWEQISQLFNPSMELQSNDNYIDWGSLTVVTLTDCNFTSRTVPTGGDEPIDVFTMTFDIPIWISTSVKVKKMGVIQRVITNFQDIDTMESLGQTVVSINNYAALLINTDGQYYLKLVAPEDATNMSELDLDVVVSQHSWTQLLSAYGEYTAGSTEIRLSTPNDSQIIGTIAVNPMDDSLLIFNPYNNTLPANTMSPINAIIDPQNVNIATYLTSPAQGTRYLLINDIGNAENGSNGAVAWQGTGGQNLIANTNDIIQYNGTYWQVMFDSEAVNSLQYVTNLTTGIQYKWQNQQWTKSYDGIYGPGEWMIVL